MIREAIKEVAKSTTFKYDGEEWKITLFPERIDLEVDANGAWTSLADINQKVKNLKGAIKVAKKEIDSFNKNY